MFEGGIVRLPVADVPAAVRFYVETLGVKLVHEAKGLAVVDCGEGFRIGLVESPPGEHRGAVTVGLVPKMPLAEAIAILENRGVVFEHGHQFRDPDGNPLYLAPDE